MGAGNDNPKEETAPAVEQSERAIQRIEDISKDTATDLGAKKEAAQKLHDEKVEAYEKAKGEGTAKGDRQAARLDGEIQRLNTAIESIDKRLKVIARESTEDKEDEAQKLTDRADALHTRAGIIESRDDAADKRDAEVAGLRVKESEQTAIIDNPASTPEAKTAALKERADIREKIERKEARKDRAEEKLKREALLRAEAEQIRADIAESERALGTLNEKTNPTEQTGAQEKGKKGPGLTERMSSSSEYTALQIADNPPKKGDFAANMGFNIKLVWLNISMAMSPKPLAWDPQKFDEGRREMLAKVAGMKLTDTADGKIKVESCPRDKEYEAPLGGTQRVFREYFGTKWWATLNGVTGPTKDKPGTKLSEFKAGIPNPPSSEEDKAKQTFAHDLAEAGMKDDEQLLPWLEKNSHKVKKEATEQTTNPDSQEAPAQKESNPSLKELNFYEGVDTFIKDQKFNSKTTSGEFLKSRSPLTPMMDALTSPAMDSKTFAEQLLTPAVGSEGVPSEQIKSILFMAQAFNREFPISPETLTLLEKPLLAPEECAQLKAIVQASLTFIKESLKKPILEVFQKELATVTSPESKASIQKAIDALKANDPPTTSAPTTTEATQGTQAEGVKETAQNYPFLNAEQIQQLKIYPGFKDLKAVKNADPKVGDSTQLSFNGTTHDFTLDGKKIEDASSFTITTGTDKVSIQVEGAQMTLTITDKAIGDAPPVSQVLVVQPKPTPVQ